MTNTYMAQAGTALSPEWDRGFDEAFTDLVTSDPDLVRDEFDALIGANFDQPPQPPAPPAPPSGEPEPPSPPGRAGITLPEPAGQARADAVPETPSPP